jgi:acetolactate synthase-1/2/3 large subunit
MRFSRAALVTFLAAAPIAEAFVPRSVERQSAAFVSRSSARPSSSLSVSISDLSNVLLQDADDLTNERVEEELSKLAAIEARAATAAYMSQYENESGASIIYSKLQEQGVTVVNGFSGGAVLPLLDQFHERHPRHAKSGKEPIRWITNSNEASAGHIAEGYAKSMPIDGEHKPVGVAIATSGPGVTNLITPLQDAICDGVPIVVLCGQAATNAPADAFQSAPAVEMTAPCTKWSYQIKSAAELPLVMDYAFYVARNGRPGPVFIDLPKDLQNQVLTSDMIDHFIDAENPGDETSFARLVKKRRTGGDVFQALHLGTDGKGLAFEVYKDSNMDQYKLKAVSDGSEDAHHLDHHPSNTIYRNSNEANGEEAKEGPLAADSELTNKLVKMMLQAKKPVIIAGQGCNDAKAELTAFAEKLQIPVTTTLHAMGCFDERNELALNMMGMHGHPTPNFMVQEADLVINIGSRFDDRITGRIGDFIPEAKKAAEELRGGILHVDIRLTEKNKQVTPTYFIHSTGKEFLQIMNNALATKEVKPLTASWIKHMKELQRDFPVVIPHFKSEEVDATDADGNKVTLSRTRSSAQSVIAELNRQLLETGSIDNAVFTTGVGIHQMVAAQLITWTQPRQMLSSGSLGTMGVALGYVIGAKLANEGKICIAVDGDGSFNMTFTELKTVAEQKIPIKIMILDNDGQMMVEYWQRLFHDNRLIAVRNSRNPDYVTLAKAFGIKSVYCDHDEDLPSKMKEFLFDDPGEPVLFHVRIERTPCLPLVAPGQPLDDMILEDIEVEVDQSAAPS